MTVSSSARPIPDLSYKPGLQRNLLSRLLTLIAGLFSAICVLPLVLVLAYVLIMGGGKISLGLLTQLPPPPGLEGGGIGNAIIGTIIVSIIAGLIAQGMAPFEAAGAATWIHGEAAAAFGPGLIAEDICEGIPGVLRGLDARRRET